MKVHRLQVARAIDLVDSATLLAEVGTLQFYQEEEEDEEEEESSSDEEQSSEYESNESSTEESQQIVISMKTLIIPGDRNTEGLLIDAVGLAWFEVIKQILGDPESVYEISCWDWEEIIAGAYKAAGWKTVILTPRSGDKGRDVIAERDDIGAIRFLDQVKAHSPHNPVTAKDVRELAGVLSLDQNATKAVITTTSYFAPGVEKEFAAMIPYRLELKPKPKLIMWLESLQQTQADRGQL